MEIKDIEGFEFFGDFSKEELQKYSSTPEGREFLSSYLKQWQKDNDYGAKNVYNIALEKSLNGERKPLKKKKKLSEETKVKILATIALIIVLLGTLHKNPDWKKGEGKASSSYSQTDDDAISHGGRK